MQLVPMKKYSLDLLFYAIQLFSICNGHQEDTLLLIYSTTADIRVTPTDKVQQTVLMNVSENTMIDFHYELQKLCWCDHNDEALLCANFDGNKIGNKVMVRDTNVSLGLFRSIEAYAKDTPTRYVKPPIEIDITTEPKTWDISPNIFDYLLNINMMHISPYNCTVGLLKNVSQVLKSGGLLITYGPYAHNGVIEPQSDIDFDKGLRRQDPEWGLRDIKDLQQIAENAGINLLKKHDLPANNKCLVWQKNSDRP